MCAESRPRCLHFIEWTIITGVLVLLTAYKLRSYRSQMNRTWAAPVSADNFWSIEHLPLRITLLARDSIAYFLVVFGLCLVVLEDHWYWHRVSMRGVEFNFQCCRCTYTWPPGVSDSMRAALNIPHSVFSAQPSAYHPLQYATSEYFMTGILF